MPSKDDAVEVARLRAENKFWEGRVSELLTCVAKIHAFAKPLAWYYEMPRPFLGAWPLDEPEEKPPTLEDLKKVETDARRADHAARVRAKALTSITEIAQESIVSSGGIVIDLTPPKERA